MTRRTLLLLLAVTAVAAGGTALWSRRAVGPPPPAVPAELNDPPARRLVETKRQAVLASPASAAAWGELAMAYDAHEAPAEATACYRRAAALDPEDARWPFLLARQVHAAGDTAEAVRQYERAVDCRPPSSAHRATAMLTLADLLTELGRGAEAVPLVEKVHAEDPTDPRAAYRVGLLLLDRGENDRAARVLLGLARSPYARKKSAIAMAELSRRAGRTKDAENFDFAAERLPPDGFWANPFVAAVGELKRGRRALMDQYVAQEGASDERGAVRTGNALADQYPSVETQMLLLRALVNAGQYRGAAAAADDILRDADGRKLVTAHSFQGLAKLGLADEAEAAGRKADADRLVVEAAAALGESVRLKPDYAPGHLYQSKALLRLGKLAEAEAAARAGVQVRPEEWEGYLAVSDVLAAAGRKAEAIAAAEQAAKLAHPDEPRAKQALAALRK